MKTITITLFATCLLFVGTLPAQQNQDTKEQNIFEVLATVDPTSSATVKVYQDKRIESLIVGKRVVNTMQAQSVSSGYRVQVYSSNTQRSAKNDAFRIERQIKEEFPFESVYVNYKSPFWKVRVGDFRTQREAQALRSQLIEKFPNMRSEIYIVREQILISGTK